MHVSDFPDDTQPPTEAPAPAEETAPLGTSQGLAVLTEAVNSLSQKPGVYRMLNAKGDALYVGKAKNLKKRVSSYLRVDRMALRLQRMVFETHAFEVVVTHT